MARVEGTATSPARLRVGLPVVPTGSERQPLLLRLPATDGAAGRCNNGCADCVTQPLPAPESAWDVDVRGHHVVVRDREATLRSDLPSLVADLRRRGAVSVTLLTNGRMLAYGALTKRLVGRGVDRVVVKLFGLDAAAHDAHTRDEGSFVQALRGIEVARAAGAKTFVTFPTPIDVADRKAELARRKDLAHALTGMDFVQLPEPQVESHGGEYRFDVVRRRGDLSRTYFAEAFFPMVHVNTGPVCNIRCLYCNVHGGDDQRLYPADYVESLVDSAAAYVGRLADRGRPTLDFIGGEPTLHPELPRLVAKARAAGFEQTTICTNGVLLMRSGYLDSLVSAGLTGVRFSFHDHRPEMANQLADVPGLGSRYVDVAELLLSRRDLQTHLFRILLASTIDALPEYVEWVADHDRSGRPIDLTLGMPSMRGRLFANRELYPPLDALRPAATRAMEIARSRGFTPSFHHTLGCFVPDAPELHACLHVETTTVEPLLDVTHVVNFEGDARFVPACDGCGGKTAGCHGLPAHYVESDPDAAAAWVVPHAYRPEAGRFDPKG